ncbi:MAG TPA: HAMP domain-containing sensor histidine kinase [Myxococcales bacterium]|jgi:signal transduction histidine kinase|nr:HAMP domain-containing sensor histidine kinase [Myxococcales bacterium]
MTEARLSVTLPEYESELAANQRTAMRSAVLLAAPLLVVFTFLDRATAPLFWIPLLGLRTAAAALLGLVARLAHRFPSTFSVAVVSVAVICATIEAGVLATGGARSPYLTSNIAVLAGVGLLMPLTAAQAAIVQLVGLAIAIVPLLFGMQAGDALPLLTSASYLVTVAIVAIAGAHLQDALRRREHRARVEVARQIGLINLGTLAGGLAHELSTPLTWVSVELESLEMDPLAASVRERVLAARAGTARMREVLIAMRQGARFAGGEMREVILAQEMDLALTLVAQRMRAAGVALSREYAADVPLLSCQPTLLGQVLVNLLINALDAMAQQEEARLIVRVRTDGAFAYVEVEDSGPGIPPELRTRIFEPFFSTKGESGNGLGLWISSEIARMHGGELVALPGAKGALFRLSFPLPASTTSAPGA